MAKALKKQSLRLATDEEFSWEFQLLIDGVVVTVWVTDVFI
jgi:hypothetical protein